MTNVIKLQDWTPDESLQRKVVQVGKSLSMHHTAEMDGKKIPFSMKFIIPKLSYQRRLPELVNFMNYFVENYQSGSEYIGLMVMHGRKFDSLLRYMDVNELPISAIYSKVFTPSIKADILDLVDDNILDVSSVVRPTNIRSIDIRQVMIVSSVIRLIIPLVFKYIDTNNLSHNSDLYSLLRPAFDVFDETADLHDRLKEFIETKVRAHTASNKYLYEHVLKQDTEDVLKWLFEDVIVSDILFKCRFEMNCMSFISVVAVKQLGYRAASPVKLQETIKKDK